MNKLSAIVAALLLVGATAPAVAGETSVGIAMTKAKIDGDSLDNGFKLFLDHMVNDNFGFEVAHGNYGEFRGGYTDGWDFYGFDAEFSATNVTLIGATPLNDNISLFGKFGLSMWKVDVDVDGYGSDSEDGDDLLLGFGLNFETGSAATFKIEYESIQVDDGDATSLNFGVGVKF